MSAGVRPRAGLRPLSGDALGSTGRSAAADLRSRSRSDSRLDLWRQDVGERSAVGIQTSLDALRAADRIVDAMRAADELAFESSRDPGVRTIRVLTEALDDTDQLVVIAAVHALGTIADGEATRAVARLLSDGRLFVREHAAWVLGSGQPRADAVARLIEMTASGGFGGMLAQRTLEQWSAECTRARGRGAGGRVAGRPRTRRARATGRDARVGPARDRRPPAPRARRRHPRGRAGAGRGRRRSRPAAG